MNLDKIQETITNYFHQIRKANNEEVKRQHFVVLLNELFGNMPSAKSILEEFRAGAERTVVNIEREGKKSKRGRADTQYRSVIIEFEDDLKKTKEHAKDQLIDYLTGNWNSGEAYNFTLISSDCIEWIIYAPDVESLPQGKRLNTSDIELIEKDCFVLNERNTLDFYYFLDSVLFRTEKKLPTLERIQDDFGHTSNAYITSLDQLRSYFSKVKNSGEVQVAYEQWKRFLSIAYDKFDDSENVFLIHTYLSIFAKMLTYEVITNDDFLDDEEIAGILTGDIFDKLNVRNFTDNDFFHWVSSEDARKALKNLFRAISSELDGYKFDHVGEDILKGVYQELIERDTRHSLGEYYTPDWLCESIVNNLELNANSRILDPSCGSGSFLRVAIERLNKEFPKLTAAEIASQVSGIDIHPLSVQISKANVLIALRDKISKSPSPIFLSVYLANTLTSPMGSAQLNLFSNNFDISIDKQKISIDTSIFNNPSRFEHSVQAAEKIANFTKNEATMSRDAFEKALAGQVKDLPSDQFSMSLYDIYKAFKTVKEADRDSIWEFIVLNLYKPCFFHKSFDYVIGNPPWFTWSDINNSQYQDELREKAIATNTWPNSWELASQMEIAAIFLAHCTEYFLKRGGRLAFVLPRSFLNAKHHEKTRTGKAKFVRIDEIWDLQKVTPLFNVPSCVFFTVQAHGNLKTKIPSTGCEGKLFAGKLSKHNSNLEEASTSLRIEKKRFYLSVLGRSNAFTQNIQDNTKNAVNFYGKRFLNGATLYPRSLVFFELDEFTEREINPSGSFKVRSNEYLLSQGKKQWKEISLSGRINGHYIYLTALANNIVPFGLYNLPKVVLPTKKRISGSLMMMTPQEILEEGNIDTADWFRRAEELWSLNRTETNKKYTLADYLNYSNKLVSQDIDAPYLVLYTASGKNANAVVYERGNENFTFVVENKTYAFYSNSLEESFYLSSFLNSAFANKKIKEYQSSGLFGPRDVHKKILDVGLPKFEPKNADHNKLAELGAQCHEKTRAYLDRVTPQANLSAHALGRLRLQVNELLSEELAEIDQLLDKINSE